MAGLRGWDQAKGEIRTKKTKANSIGAVIEQVEQADGWSFYSICRSSQLVIVKVKVCVKYMLEDFLIVFCFRKFKVDTYGKSLYH